MLVADQPSFHLFVLTKKYAKTTSTKKAELGDFGTYFVF